MDIRTKSLHPVLVIFTLAVLAILPALSEPAQFNQLPAPAQESVNAVRDRARVQSVERVVRNGKLAYEVRLDRPSGLNHFYVSETGVIWPLENFPARPPLSDAVKIGFPQLPMPVLSTIQTYAGASFVRDLEKGTVNGRTIYQACFDHRGHPVEVRLYGDGSLVQDQANEQFLARYNRELGLPAKAGVGTIATGESHSASGSSEGTSTNTPPRR